MDTSVVPELAIVVAATAGIVLAAVRRTVLAMVIAAILLAGTLLITSMMPLTSHQHIDVLIGLFGGSFGGFVTAVGVRTRMRIAKNRRRNAAEPPRC